MGICTFTRGVWMDWKCGGGRFRSGPGKLQGKGKLLKRTRMLGGEASGENQEVEGDKLSIQHWWTKNTKQKRSFDFQTIAILCFPDKNSAFSEFLPKEVRLGQNVVPSFQCGEGARVPLSPGSYAPVYMFT